MMAPACACVEHHPHLLHGLGMGMGIRHASLPISKPLPPAFDPSHLHRIVPPPPIVRVVHIRAPKVIQTDVANFRALVQKLTGNSKTSHRTSKKRRKSHARPLPEAHRAADTKIQSSSKEWEKFPDNKQVQQQPTLSYGANMQGASPLATSSPARPSLLHLQQMAEKALADQRLTTTYVTGNASLLSSPVDSSSSWERPAIVHNHRTFSDLDILVSSAPVQPAPSFTQSQTLSYSHLQQLTESNALLDQTSTSCGESSLNSPVGSSNSRESFGTGYHSKFMSDLDRIAGLISSVPVQATPVAYSEMVSFLNLQQLTEKASDRSTNGSAVSSPVDSSSSWESAEAINRSEFCELDMFCGRAGTDNHSKFTDLDIISGLISSVPVLELPQLPPLKLPSPEDNSFLQHQACRPFPLVSSFPAVFQRF